MKTHCESQGELPLGSKLRRSPVEKAADASRLQAVLAARGRMTAAAICLAFGWDVSEDNKRYVRKLVETLPGVLSHPGSHGYILESLANADEIYASGDAFIEAGKALIARGIQRRRLAGLRRAAEVLTMSEADRGLRDYLAGEGTR